MKKGLARFSRAIFRIMDDPEDGYTFFTETQTVTFINGYYSVLLVPTKAILSMIRSLSIIRSILRSK